MAGTCIAGLTSPRYIWRNFHRRNSRVCSEVDTELPYCTRCHPNRESRGPCNIRHSLWLPRGFLPVVGPSQFYNRPQRQAPRRRLPRWRIGILRFANSAACEFHQPCVLSLNLHETIDRSRIPKQSESGISLFAAPVPTLPLGRRHTAKSGFHNIYVRSRRFVTYFFSQKSIQGLPKL